MSQLTQPKKRLIICADGTWNNSVSTDSELTNFLRLSRCIQDVAEDGVVQIVYYHAGIGSGTSRLSNSVDVPRDEVTQRLHSIRSMLTPCKNLIQCATHIYFHLSEL